MNEESKYENISNLFIDSFSILENSFKFSLHEQNNLDYKDINKEEQKKNFPQSFNLKK